MELKFDQCFKVEVWFGFDKASVETPFVTSFISSIRSSKGTFQKRFSGIRPLRGYPPPLLTENQSGKKKVFFLRGKGGSPPPP